MDHQTFDSLITGTFEHRLFAYMKLVGINKIEVNYSGGGDSGGVDNIEIYNSNESANPSISSGLRDDLEEDLSSPVYNRHGGFADGGGYYVNGDVVYNANNKTIHISGVDHISEYGDEQEDGDYEETTREEEWEECLFDNDKAENNRDVNCQFAFMYARDVIKGKFQEEFHNKMLTYAAINKDEYAEDYLKMTK